MPGKISVPYTQIELDDDSFSIMAVRGPDRDEAPAIMILGTGAESMLSLGPGAEGQDGPGPSGDQLHLLLGAQDAPELDELHAKAIEAALAAGIKLIGLEEAPGAGTWSGILGPRASDALAKGRQECAELRVVVVDDLARVNSMNRVREKGFQYLPIADRFFTTLRQHLRKAIDELPTSDTAAFVRGRYRMLFERTSGSEQARLLLDLEPAMEQPFDEMTKRSLVLLNAEGRDREAAEREQSEIGYRLQKYAGAGMLNSDMLTRFEATLATSDGVDGSGKQSLALTDSGLALMPRTHATALAATRQAVDFGTTWRTNHRPELAVLLGIDLSAYRNAMLLTTYSHMLTEIGEQHPARRVLDWFNAAWSQAGAELPLTPEERLLDRVCQHLSLLRRLERFQLDPDSYEMLAVASNEITAAGIVEQLGGLVHGVATRKARQQARAIDRRTAELCRFYILARERSREMALNLVKAMKRHNLDRAMLVCLGFHLPIVHAILASEDIAQTTVIPSMPEELLDRWRKTELAEF